MISIDYYNGSQCVLSGPELDIVREHFSAENKAARFQRNKLRSRFIKDRIYAITPKGRVDIGLLPLIFKFCEKNSIKVKFLENKVFGILRPSLPKPTIDFDLQLPLRDYQRVIVDKCIEAGRGTIELATSGGKTLTMASLIEYYFQNVNKFFSGLIIVPDLGLVNQTYNDFKEYDVSFTHSIWSGKNELQQNNNIVVANMGILQSEKSDVAWTKDIDLLIVDETHKLRRDNKINNVIKNIKTSHKFGFTGTLPEDPLDMWNVFGKIGPKLYTKMAHELRDENYVTPARVHILNLNYKSKQVYDKHLPMNFFLQEKEFIKNNEYRNTLIGKLTNRLNNNALILIDYIEHGEILLEFVTKHCPGKQVYFIQGNVDVDERRRIQKLMETETNVVVIAISKIFSTGINIKNLHYIVFANGGKAKVRVIQSIGRGLRLHSSKKELIIFDIADNLKYGKRHVTQRERLYDIENIKYEHTEHFEK